MSELPQAQTQQNQRPVVAFPLKDMWLFMQPRVTSQVANRFISLCGKIKVRTMVLHFGLLLPGGSASKLQAAPCDLHDYFGLFSGLLGFCYSLNILLVMHIVLLTCKQNYVVFFYLIHLSLPCPRALRSSGHVA